MPSVRLGGAVITNPSKPFWPDDGLTKLDLAQFYARIAGHIVPWMKGRAVTLERCPEGMRKACFFQKQAPANLPAGIPTVTIPAPSAGHDVEWIVGGTRKTLLTLVNLGCIAMHVMDSRVDQLDKPDWLAFDLDPADGFASAARSGAAAAGQARRSRPRTVREDIGRARTSCLRAAAPRRGTGSGSRLCVGNRGGNGGRASGARDRRDAQGAHGVRRCISTSCAMPPARPSCRRSRCGGARARPVSMPLDWDEVSPRLDPNVFTIRTAERRMGAKAPWSSFFGHRQTLPRV